MKIIPYKSIWLSLSAVLVLASLLFIGLYGFKLSADFTEGSLLAIRFEEKQEIPSETEKEQVDAVEDTGISQEGMREIVNAYPTPEGQEGLGSVDIKKSADGTFIIKTRQLSEEEHEAFLSYIRESLGNFEVLQSRDVSPVYAKTFRDRALLALVVASLMIILYISFAFRRVSRGIKSWKLGVTAIIALIHDVLVIVGIFVLLGQFFGVEIDALFITALLSVMGFSVNDTIVVFDRVRENLLTKHHSENFDEVAEKSLQQTMARSINTSFSTLLVLIALLLFGAYEIFYFVLALSLGVVVGTYSSIFLATPLLTIIQKKA